jgi:two-component system response regulator DevR
LNVDALRETMLTATQSATRRTRDEDGALATVAPIRLLVVDDHPAVRRGLSDLLEDQPDFRVIAAVGTAEDAMSVAEREIFDVAIVDYQLPGRNGLWVSRKLKRLPRPPRVLIYSAYYDGLLAASAVVAEADGLVSKGGLGAELCDAIRTVAGGRSSFPVVPWQLAETMRRRLQDEEQAIFGMTLAGMAPAEIAQTLGLSAAELESRLWEMLRKLENLDPESRARNQGRAGRVP